MEKTKPIAATGARDIPTLTIAGSPRNGTDRCKTSMTEGARFAVGRFAAVGVHAGKELFSKIQGVGASVSDALAAVSAAHGAIVQVDNLTPFVGAQEAPSAWARLSRADFRGFQAGIQPGTGCEAGPDASVVPTVGHVLGSS